MMYVRNAPLACSCYTLCLVLSIFIQVWVGLFGSHAFTFREPFVTAWRYNPVGGGAWLQHRPFCVQLSRPTRGQAFWLQGPIT